MKITTITDIQSLGTFESSFGTMYKFQYCLDDGTIGEANHKTNASPFKVGASVAYDITGTSPKGMSKLKIGKPESANFAPSQTSGGTQTHSTASNAPKSQGNDRADGARNGLCLKLAVDILIASDTSINPATIAQYAKMVKAGMDEFEGHNENPY